MCHSLSLFNSGFTSQTSYTVGMSEDSRGIRIWQIKKFHVFIEDDWKLLWKQLVEAHAVMTVHPVCTCPVIPLWSTARRQAKKLFSCIISDTWKSTSSLTWWERKARSVCLESVCWWRRCHGPHRSSLSAPHSGPREEHTATHEV